MTTTSAAEFDGTYCRAETLARLAGPVGVAAIQASVGRRGTNNKRHSIPEPEGRARRSTKPGAAPVEAFVNQSLTSRRVQADTQNKEGSVQTHESRRRSLPEVKVLTLPETVSNEELLPGALMLDQTSFPPGRTLSADLQDDTGQPDTEAETLQSSVWGCYGNSGAGGGGWPVTVPDFEYSDRLKSAERGMLRTAQKEERRARVEERLAQRPKTQAAKGAFR